MATEIQKQGAVLKFSLCFAMTEELKVYAESMQNNPA